MAKCKALTGSAVKGLKIPNRSHQFGQYNGLLTSFSAVEHNNRRLLSRCRVFGWLFYIRFFQLHNVLKQATQGSS